MKLRLSRFSEMIRLTSISSSRGDVVALAEREHQALQLRHVERRGRALAGDVGDQHAEAVARQLEEVVVVPADLARRHAQRRDRRARARRAARAAAATSGSARAMRSSSSSRFFSAAVCSSPSMLPVIWLNESGQLAELIVRLRCRSGGAKSPWRTRSVPMNSSWIELVIERASARPMLERDDLDDQEQPGDHQQHDDRQLAERHVR